MTIAQPLWAASFVYAGALRGKLSSAISEQEDLFELLALIVERPR